MQLTDKDGNVYGWNGLEITTSSGKPKVPVINTDITIGTTAIVGGVAGRLLFDDAGVVGETNGVHWDKVNSRLGLGTATPTQTLDIQGDISMGVSGATTVRTFYNSTTRNQLIYTNNSSLEFFQSINERMRLAPGSGNLLLNTTTDAGYKLDVNGTAAIRGTTNVIGGTLRIASTGTLTQPSYITSHSDGGWNYTTYTHERGAGVHYFTSNNGSASIFSASAREGVIINVSSLTTGNPFSISGTVNASSAIARSQLINATLVASANNDVLVGLDIAPTYTNGAFTGLANIDLRTKGSGLVIGSGVGYGAIYGYDNDGLLQLKTNGTSTELWFRPNNSAVSFNSSYWGTIIQESYSFKILSGSYQSLVIATARAGGNGGIMSFSGATGAANNAITIAGPANAGRIALVTYGSSPITLNGGNILINTTTDAGFKLDVAGSTRIQGNTTLTGTLTMGNGSFSYSANPNNWFTISGNQGLILNQANGNVGSIVLGASNSANFTVALTNTTMYGVSISRPVTPIAGSTNLTYNSLEIDNVIDYTNATSSIVRGLYIHPTLTSVTDFRAIETTVGNVLFGTTSGNVGIGTTTPTTLLDVNGTVKALYVNTPLIYGSGDLDLAAAGGTTGILIKNATRNVLINTTVDSGYKLDVNGSARVQSGLTVSGSLNLNSSDISSSWTAYTPAWTSNGTQPSLGNGSLTGAYKIVGKTCFVRVRLALGTTSTGGTGHWLFSLPVAAIDPDTIQFACSMLDNGLAWYQGTVNGTYAGHTDKTAIIALSGGGANSSEAVTAIRPFTWGSTDSLQFNGSYEIA